MQPVGERAVVMGASMGGLLAARALANHFREVVLVERDTFPPVGEHRRGVPQGRHAHGLLSSGLDALERYFPGLTQELVEAGGLAVDPSRDGRWFDQGGYLCRYTSGMRGLLVSRPLLEAHVRRRLLLFPHVRIIEDCDALGIEANASRTTVVGVRLIRRSPGNAVELLSADLVVDATGRGSKSPVWLEALGYDRPQEEHVKVGLGYTTGLFRRRPGQLDGDLFAITGLSRGRNRVGAAFAQENNLWIVTLVGYVGDHAPTEPEGFRQFARTLSASDLGDLVTESALVGELVSARFPSSQRRFYDRLDRFPDGYLVIGDAVSSFTPIYAQGMTAAALQAEQLDRCLCDGTVSLSKRFFKRIAILLDVPWQIGASGDLRVPGVEGKRTPLVLFVNWYLDRLLRVARWEPTVTKAFRQVGNLQAPPQRVMKPAILLRVLWGHLRPRKAGKTAPLRVDPS